MDVRQPTSHSAWLDVTIRPRERMSAGAARRTAVPGGPGREQSMSSWSDDTMGRERADEGHTARVRRLVEEACNNGNLAVLDEILARPARLTDEDVAEALAPARLRPLLAEFRASVPDARWSIVE